jgi:predicted dehydrogenase
MEVHPHREGAETGERGMSSRSPLRIGLAGLGALYWPFALADGIKGNSHARLTAFATLGQPEPEIRAHIGMDSEAFARYTGARRFVNAADMVKAGQVDAIALCGRHTEHARQVEQLAPLGRDLAIFKTMAASLADADRICAAGKKNRVRIAVGPSARFLPWFVAARKAVDAGRIGTPFSMRVAHHHGTIDVFGPGDFYREAAEGGPELSLGWYMVDLVMHFMGRPVVDVSASYGTFTSKDSPFMDLGRMSLRLAGGALAACDMYFCNRFDFPRWEMELVGDKGALLVRQPLEGGGEPAVTLTTAAGVRAIPLPARTPHWELFWIDELRGSGPPSLDAAYARDVTRVCLAARDAAARSASPARPAPRRR